MKSEAARGRITPMYHPTFCGRGPASARREPIGARATHPADMPVHRARSGTVHPAAPVGAGSGETGTASPAPTTIRAPRDRPCPGGRRGASRPRQSLLTLHSTAPGAGAGRVTQAGATGRSRSARLRLRHKVNPMAFRTSHHASANTRKACHR